MCIHQFFIFWRYTSLRQPKQFALDQWLNVILENGVKNGKYVGTLWIYCFMVHVVKQAWYSHDLPPVRDPLCVFPLSLSRSLCWNSPWSCSCLSPSRLCSNSSLSSTRRESSWANSSKVSRPVFLLSTGEMQQQSVIKRVQPKIKFWCDLLCFGYISYRDVCLLNTVIELDSTCLYGKSIEKYAW